MTIKRIYEDGTRRRVPADSIPTESVITADFDYEQVADAMVQMTSRHTGPVTAWQWSVDGDEASTARDPLLSFNFVGLFRDYTIRMTVWPGPVFAEQLIRVTQTDPVGAVLDAKTLTWLEAKELTPDEAGEMVGA